MQHTFIIGLTGGIGSGKSAVSAIFERLGAEVIDADVVSRELVATGEPALRQLAALAGESMLHKDGSLNRAALRERLFRDPELKQAVEQLLHPLIRQRIRERIAASRKLVTVLVAPLLLETRAYDFVDRVLVVDAPEALQINRVIARDSSTQADVEGIMRNQLARETRLQHAHDVILNDGDLAQLEHRVSALYDFYQTLAKNRTNDFTQQERAQ